MDRHPIVLVASPPSYEGSAQRPRSACTVGHNRQWSAKCRLSPSSYLAARFGLAPLISQLTRRDMRSDRAYLGRHE